MTAAMMATITRIRIISFICYYAFSIVVKELFNVAYVAFNMLKHLFVYG